MSRKFLQPLAVAISLALSTGSAFAASSFDVSDEIGRASCRERVSKQV